MSMNEIPPMIAWKTNNAGAININENSSGSVIPETKHAATPAIMSAFTFAFLS